MVALTLVVVAVVSGYGVHGALPRGYSRVEAEAVAPATNTGLGRAVAAMDDLHYLCTEGKPSRPNVRSLVCSGPEGWAEIESNAAGKVTYLTLVGRGDEMTDERAGALGRALINGADLSQDARIAARSVTDGRAGVSSGPWGSAFRGDLPTRLVFVGADRAKDPAKPSIGPAAALAVRLSKQSCTTETKPSPTPTVASAPAAPSGTPAGPAATPATTGALPATAASPVTRCTTSSRLVTTEVAYEQTGDQVTRVSIRSSAPFAFGWVRTEAVVALRAALTDLGRDAGTVGDWVHANAGRQGTVNLGELQVELNTVAPRSVTSVTVSRVL